MRRDGRVSDPFIGAGGSSLTSNHPEVFQAFQKHCRVETGGYVSILDVNQVPVETEDRMETFWLSETLSEFGSVSY